MSRARWLAAAAVLAVLLAGCAGHPARPGHRSAGARPAATAGAASARHADGVRDDLSKDQRSRYRDGNDSVPSGPPPDLSRLAEPVPHVEPRSAYGNKSPYTVLGHTYRVLPSAKGYVERGIASFYGNKFHGYKTSSLENYDMYQFSAAHKTLPLPSYARVTNLANGKSVIVRINDRGPFHANRLIDLSYVAAVKIGVWPGGTGMVEVRAIDPADPDASPAASATAHAPPAGGAAEPAVVSPVPVPGGASAIYLQVGAFSDQGNADRLAQRLREANIGPVQISDKPASGGSIRRVRVGPMSDARQADAMAGRIEALGLPHPQVAVD
ncbi:septal ring lytic transglycosylase RlpA family protein [Dyella sp.]|jgi:rare lipoprotein A|uniref:septal ring lytic transglycosylase RlpA family protein n=1 Tax=Dyella sp. TaxID=1869338 RepID=UPI002D776989|nr:septal ring lytic transglycosylase RlpA family protein [Dyella sp.]HET6432872.1 septal ring lytic transglycosylase RlpA family protein [Dyella sp.]